MRRRNLLALAAGAAAFRPLVGSAQQPKAPTVGLLIPSKQFDRGVTLLRQGLHTLGYVEGQNIQLDIRSAEDDFSRLPALAAELVRLKVDAIAAIATPAALAAKHATGTIPIVMVAADPIANKLVDSLSRPGGNITGVSSVNSGLGPKLVELLREAVPGTSRIAVLLNAPDQFSGQLLQEVQVVGAAQRVEIVPFMVGAGLELDAAFPAMVESKIEAVIVQGSLPVKRIADLMIKHRLPAGAPGKIFALNGGLISYSPNGAELMRAAAVLVDKVLKGRKPADLPVEQSTRFELTINLKTAEALGLTLPQSLLARADELIE
jgi:putative tryptophan/tyrosine transport system substrate-binding protein